jgi:hypothetical protein
MVEARTYSESEGEFTKKVPVRVKCPACGHTSAKCETWESSCGGYEDEKYTCLNVDCGHIWWVDGIDS